MKKIITFLALSLMMSCSVDDELVQAEEQTLLTSNATVNCTEFTAGNDASGEFLLAEAEAIRNLDQLRRRYLLLLDDGIPTDGTFSPTMQQIVKAFNTGDKIGEYSTTYTVKNSFGCVDSTILTLFVVEELTPELVCDLDAGSDVKFEKNVSEVESLSNLDKVRKLFIDQLEEGVSINGNFEPTIQKIVEQFNQGERVGEYTVKYTITDGECTDSLFLTLVVVADPIVCDLDAGNDSEFTLTVAEASSIASEDHLKRLYLQSSDVNLPTDGVFSPSLQQIISDFNSGEPTGSYLTKYTVSNSDGCSDSVNLTLNVVENSVICDISAGADKMSTITLSQADALPNLDRVKLVFLKMLDEGVSTTGSFDPTIKKIVEDFNAGNKIGEYTVKYTVSNGECSDSTILTLKVIEDRR